MSIRWMAVQFVGNTLRLPIVNKPDMDKPFGSSELEREVRRIVVNPFSDNPQTFVPEAENDRLRKEFDKMDKWHSAELTAAMDENAKLRELMRHMHTCMGNVDADGNHECFSCEYEGADCDYDYRMRELGIEGIEVD